jgi:hypothetical protein
MEKSIKYQQSLIKTIDTLKNKLATYNHVVCKETTCTKQAIDCSEHYGPRRILFPEPIEPQPFSLERQVHKNLFKIDI